MSFTANYADAQNQTVERSDMPGTLIPAAGGNRHFNEIVEAGVSISEYTPPAPTVSDVIVERTRRLALGFEYDFGDDRGVHTIATTEEDMSGWDEVTDYANALIAAEDTTTQITIVTETGSAVVTAQEWQAVLLAAAAFRQPIWSASFALMAMDPIPDDYTDDSYWS